jgi:hypothetical protein
LELFDSTFNLADIFAAEYIAANQAPELAVAERNENGKKANDSNPLPSGLYRCS